MTTPAGPLFDDAYIGVPPWDIGHPQREVLALADAGSFRSPVLDAGCGTGENALALAARGLEVVGLDASPRAIGKAMDKARERRLDGVDFLVADAVERGTELVFLSADDDDVARVYARVGFERIGTACAASVTGGD